MVLAQLQACILVSSAGAPERIRQLRGQKRNTGKLARDGGGGVAIYIAYPCAAPPLTTSINAGPQAVGIRLYHQCLQTALPLCRQGGKPVS